ncbi:MAG: DUF115 domain-containing protein [Methylomarinum sp.]|nr:DUF115 domain-containing protein [Methylomarinum sp.]
MLSFKNISLPRKHKVRIKRWFLGREYRHMAKISRHFKITNDSDPAIIWKKETLCTLLPLPRAVNSFNGKTAYIVASGPSINDVDITLLDNKFTFGVNGSIMKFIDTPVSPYFYVISDEDFIYNRPHLLPFILNKNCHCFFTPQVLSAICEINPELLRNHNKITLFNNHFKDHGNAALECSDIEKLAIDDSEIITDDGRIGFSLNPEKGVFTAHTVPYFALQIAYGLGFRTINFVGMDLGSSTGETRFYESGTTAMPSHLDRDYFKTILPSFEIAGRLCKTNILQIYNLSPSSRLPDKVIKKKSFYEAIKDN